MRLYILALEKNVTQIKLQPKRGETSKF